MKDPWRFPVLATSHNLGIGVGARIVVLREADRVGRWLIGYSDSRSAKIQAIRDNPNAVWVFYDLESRIQVRVNTQVTLHMKSSKDPFATTHWARIPESQRSLYGQMQSPGSVINVEPGLDLEIENSSDGDYFTVIQAQVTEIDLLWLGPHSQERVRFIWQTSGWERTRIAP